MQEINRSPSLLGLSMHDMSQPGVKRWCDFETGFNGADGKWHRLFTANIVVRSESRLMAVAALITAPVWIPLRAIGSILSSLGSIMTLGEESVKNSFVKDTPAGRLKAMGSSLLSILTTPINMVVKGAATVGHVISPTASKVDLLAAHMWTGFVVAKCDESPAGPSV